MLTQLITEVITSFLAILGVTWWLWLPLMLGLFFWTLWIFYIQNYYIKNLKWIHLEVKVPPDIEKTPKAMEQVFAELHAPFSYGLTAKEKYWIGRVEDWFSFEIVGSSGGIHFYLRTVDSHRSLVESAIYSQYPGAEIQEVEDYLDIVGSFLPNKLYDIWGTDFKLQREDAYPLRTYPAFEEKTDEALIDPFGAFTETMSKLKEGEMIFLQCLIRPTDDKWKKVGEATRDKLLDRKKTKKKNISDHALDFARNLVSAPLTAPTWAEEKKEDKPANVMLLLTTGEKDVIEGIERKIAKFGFETTIRFIFVDNRESFTRSHISAIMGAFRQFNTQNLNALIPNKTVTTLIKKGIFKNRRAYLRKRKIYDNYRQRRQNAKPSILNIEELATIFHFPSIAVKSPFLRPVAAKKGGPPPSLPVE